MRYGFLIATCAEVKELEEQREVGLYVKNSLITTKLLKSNEMLEELVKTFENANLTLALIYELPSERESQRLEEDHRTRSVKDGKRKLIIAHVRCHWSSLFPLLHH